MQKGSIGYLLAGSFLFFCNISNATVFNAIADGDWSDTGVWDQGNLPGANDTVIIDGFTIDITTNDITVKRISITNASGTDKAQLIIDVADTVTVTGNVLVTAENISEDVELKVKGSSILVVNGNVDFIRTAGNTSDKYLRLYALNDAKVYVGGTFTFDYKNSGSSESNIDIYLNYNAILDVSGITTLITRDGKALDFQLSSSSQAILRDSLYLKLLGGQTTAITAENSSHFQLTGHAVLYNSGGSNLVQLKAKDSGGQVTVNGNVSLESATTNFDVKLEADGNGAQLNITGDITMSAQSDGDVVIDLKGNGRLNLGGEILRPTNYGALKMESGTSLTYNGTETQTIACNKLDGSGTDSLYYGIVYFDNSSGTPMNLEGPLTIYDDLQLTNGVIGTTSTNILTIADQATISGGTSSAYIDGPVVKQGRTNGAPFVFPLGDGSTYAPLEMSTVSTASSQYTAQYLNCPPPFGSDLNTGVDHISNKEYWTFTRTSGSDAVNVTLYWVDAGVSGIDNTSSLIMAYYDTTNGWTSLGSEDLTTGLFSGNGGSLSNLLSCPPPFGSEKFTFASTNSLNALPVELSGFKVQLDGDEVELSWQTASETNSSHFVVERSVDAIYFDEIGMVKAAGNSLETQYYSFRDPEPIEGHSFYRLIQLDIDGMMMYSSIESIFIFYPEPLVIFPNPVVEVLQLTGFSSNSNEPGYLELFNEKGQRIYMESFSLRQESYQIPVERMNITLPGFYFLKFRHLNNSQVLKFIKVP